MIVSNFMASLDIIANISLLAMAIAIGGALHSKDEADIMATHRTVYTAEEVSVHQQATIKWIKLAVILGGISVLSWIFKS